MFADLVCKTLAWALVASLSGLMPATAAIRLVVGQVVNSSGATLDGAAIPPGETMITGDTLNTAKGGFALVKFSGTARAGLDEETVVVFRKKAGDISAQVTKGILEMETLGQGAPLVETADYVTEPTGRGRSIFQVALLPDRGTVIIARLGAVAIKEIRSGRTYLLPEGYAAISTAVQDESGQEKEEPRQAPGVPAGPSTGPKTTKAPHSPNHNLIFILAGLAGAGGILAAIAAGGSSAGPPSSPSQP